MAADGIWTWRDLRSSKTMTLAVAAIAIFTDVFIYSVVVPITPHALLHRVGVKAAEVQFYTSIFLAAYGSALIVCCIGLGLLLELDIRRRWPFLVGLFILAISTSLLCAGSSIAFLVSGRVLSGASSSIVWVVGMAMVIERFDGSNFGLVYGVLAVSENAATYGGPVVGGAVFTKWGWYAVFIVVFVLLSLDAIGRLLLNDKDIASQHRQQQRSSVSVSPCEDPESRPSAVEETIAQMSTPKEDDEAMPGATDPDHIIGRVVLWQIIKVTPAVSMDSLTSTEHTATETPPAVDYHIRRLATVFRKNSTPMKRCVTACWAVFTQSWMQAALNALIPLHLTRTFNWSSESVGLVFLPMMTATLLAPVVGRCSDRHGPCWYALTGYLLVGMSFILLRLIVNDTRACKISLHALSAVLGIGMCLILVPMTAELSEAFIAWHEVGSVTSKSPRSAMARSCALITAAWAAGSILGPYLGGAMADHAGWNVTVTTIGGMSMLAALPVIIWTQRSRPEA